MGRIEKYKKFIIERANKKLLGESEVKCPEATQESDINTKNKKTATEKYEYGKPEAKNERCGNCNVFDQSRLMRECMGNESKEVGYCWSHEFMCSQKKWCNTWGPRN